MRSTVLSPVLIVFVFLCSTTPNLSLAGQISIGDFSTMSQVQDFDVLGPSSISHAAPLLIGVDSFDSNNGLLNSSSKFGLVIGTNGTALSNDPESSSATASYIDIHFGNSTIRAGLNVGSQFPWTANVEFYNVLDNLLGAVSLSGSGNDNGFAAWQAAGDLIKRIRITDVNSSGFFMIIDNVTQEIPEPISIFQFLIPDYSLVSGKRDRTIA